MGIDVWMRNSAYVTYRTERLATIPENVTQDLSRYTTIVVVGDRATGSGARIRIAVACAQPIWWLPVPRTARGCWVA